MATTDNDWGLTPSLTRRQIAAEIERKTCMSDFLIILIVLSSDSGQLEAYFYQKLKPHMDYFSYYYYYLIIINLVIL